MEPVLKRAKLTGHFRVALKPQDVNIQKVKNDKLKRLHDTGKENNIEVIIVDDEDEQKQPQQQQQYQQQQLKGKEDLKKQQEPQPKQIITRQPEEPLTDRQKDATSNKSYTKNFTINKYNCPPGIKPDLDHDRSSLANVLYEPHYALDSFKYDRKREVLFKTRKYLDSAKHRAQRLTAAVRSRYICWVVSLQDSFDLWHDTIYMAVKLADLYLMRKSVDQRDHQLLYLTTILISSKYEERLPSVDIEALLRAAPDYHYTRCEMISFEADILRTLDFDLRFPLSFGFLRRYVHATRSNVETLHLSRYILESSLLDYEMIEELESKMAAASLYLAFKMLNPDNEADWSEAAEFYTGYKREELEHLIPRLNDMIRKRTIIRRKYSHQVFLSVSTRIPPLVRRAAISKDSTISSSQP